MTVRSFESLGFRSILSIGCVVMLLALSSGCRCLHCVDGPGVLAPVCGGGLCGGGACGGGSCGTGACNRNFDPILGDCNQCGVCGGNCPGYTPCGYLKYLLTCAGGCGEIYYGEWVSDPPDCCDPCNDCGQWAGRGCCVRKPVGSCLKGFFGAPHRGCGGCGWGACGFDGCGASCGGGCGDAGCTSPGGCSTCAHGANTQTRMSSSPSFEGEHIVQEQPRAGTPTPAKRVAPAKPSSPDPRALRPTNTQRAAIPGRAPANSPRYRTTPASYHAQRSTAQRLADGQ